MAISTLSSVVPKRIETFAAIKAFFATLVSSLNTMLTELYYREIVVTVPIYPHASKTIHTLFAADESYTVQSIKVTPDVAQGGTLTATVVKAVGTSAPSAATTPMHTAAAINLNGTAHTVQSITLTETAADLAVVAGNRIGIVLSAALSTGSANVSIRLRRTTGT